MREDDEQLSNLWHAMQNITRSPFWESFDRLRQTNAEFSIFGHSFREFFPSAQKYNRPIISLEPLTVQLCPLGPQPPIELEYGDPEDVARATLAFVGRRMVTTEGRYLGLAPDAVQKGDVIAIVYGCNFPVVLRKCGEFYLVIGESYIDGIMDGELIEAKERGEYSEVELTFC